MMPVLPGGRARVFLYRGACDLRRSFDGLARMVTEELREDPFLGDWFVFLSADRRKAKILFWDEDGYALWYKRLETGRFVPPEGDGTSIGRTELALLLEGVKAEIVSRQPRFRRENRKIIEK
jgi:transposase